MQYKCDNAFPNIKCVPEPFSLEKALYKYTACEWSPILLLTVTVDIMFRVSGLQCIEDEEWQQPNGEWGWDLNCNIWPNTARPRMNEIQRRCKQSVQEADWDTIES